jgi:hypothetical protein
MNMLKKKYLLSFFLLFVLLFLPLNVFADSPMFNAQNTVSLNKDQIINHDYFTAGKRVIINGTINGDAYIAGGQIDINGIITGDLLVAGGNIVIRGNVNQNIRGVGGNITIEGRVVKNISLAGGNIMIDKSATIGGNVVLAGGNGQIAGNILGDVTAGIGMLDLTPGTVIQGNLNYWSNSKATITSEVSVLKSTTFHQTNFRQPMIKERRIFSDANGFFGIIGFVSSLIFGILLIWLFPIYSQKLADNVTNKFWLSLLIGFVTLIIVPITIVLLLITVIGIPFAILLAFAYGFILYLSKLFVALAIGQFINAKGKWNIHPIWTFVGGLVIYYLVGIIPVIGALMKVIVLFAGLGTIVMQKKYYFSMLRDKKIV